MTDTTTTETAETETTTAETTTTTPAASEETTEDKSLITEGTEKPEEPEPPLTAADLALPEGTEIDEASQAKFIDILNEDLSRGDLAGKLLTLQSEMSQAASDSISEAWNTMQEEWKTAAQAHPDFGGDKLAPALGSVKELINEVMGDKASEVFDALDLTGVGSHPALISLLHKLAVDRAEGKAAVGAPSAPAQSMADIMFPNQGQ